MNGCDTSIVCRVVSFVNNFFQGLRASPARSTWWTRLHWMTCRRNLLCPLVDCTQCELTNISKQIYDNKGTSLSVTVTVRVGRGQRAGGSEKGGEVQSTGCVELLWRWADTRGYMPQLKARRQFKDKRGGKQSDHECPCLACPQAGRNVAAAHHQCWHYTGHPRVSVCVCDTPTSSITTVRKCRREKFAVK